MKFFHHELQWFPAEPGWFDQRPINPYYEGRIQYGNHRLWVKTNKSKDEYFVQFTINSGVGRCSPRFATEQEGLHWAEQEVLNVLSEEIADIEWFRQHLLGGGKHD